MAKQIIAIRHAQGYHNLNVENHQLRDPSLTPNGITQCHTLCSQFPFTPPIDLIVVSPLRRTILTALHTFSPFIKAHHIPIIALPELQETSDLPCDTGSSVSALQTEFKEWNIDFGNVPKEWYDKSGKWACTAGAISERAREARGWLKGRKEGNIVVVTHGAFLHYFTDDWGGIGDLNAGSGWSNTEWRGYNFVDDDDETQNSGTECGSGTENGNKNMVRLIETTVSRERRRGFEKPLSEAEQRNLKAIAVKTWEEIGFLTKEEVETVEKEEVSPLDSLAKAQKVKSKA